VTRGLVVFVLLLAAPAAAQDRRPLELALAGYFAAEGADLATTCYALGAGGVHEANPFFAPFTNRPALAGAVKMGAAAATSWMLLREHEQHPKLTLLAAVAGAAFYSGVAWHNAHIPRSTP